MAGGDQFRAFTGRYVIVDFLPDWAGIARCAVGPELKAACTDIAELRAKPYAIRISPRSRNNTPGHRHYQDSFTVKTGTTVINDMRRVAARLWNMSDHAVIVEFGNDQVPPHRILGKTMDYLVGPIVGDLPSVILDARRAARKAARGKGKGNKD
jgi:hypothetical protein